jgi:hypothetical protein
VQYRHEDAELLEQWRAASVSADCWFPFEGWCFMSDKPEVRFDESGRLHNEKGPAVTYSDGTVVHCWRGIRVPSEWIEGTPDPALALTWENVEQRRCLAEILGWSRVLEQLDPVTVDRDDDPEIGELLRVDLPDATGEQFLKVRCGTGRDFVLPVPPNVRTAREANAWTYGLEPDELEPEVRT